MSKKDYRVECFDDKGFVYWSRNGDNYDEIAKLANEVTRTHGVRIVEITTTEKMVQEIC